MPIFTRVKVFLMGKCASYRLNAYDDAAIAEEILCFIHTGEMPAGDLPIHLRAAHLITITPDDHKQERLAVQAYTMFHLNGYADLMWSRFIEKLAGFGAPRIRHGYHKYEHSPIDLFYFWAPTLL